MRKILMVVLLLAGCGWAQNTVPDTAPGKLLKQWMDSFNTGDLARHAKFVEDHESAEALRGVPPAEIAERELRFRDTVGGFDFFKAEESTPTELKAVLKQRNGLGYAAVLFKVDAAKPDLIAGTDFRPVATPDEAKPAREDDAALAKDVDQLLTRLAGEDRFSGVVLLAKNGKPFLQKAYNYADRKKKVENNINTKFRLGSMNKMFTSVAIAQLVQQGKLKYTDTVAQLLPDSSDNTVTSKITVHQLLTHTSGMGDIFTDQFDAQQNKLHTLKDYIPLFAGKPLQFEPGKGWAYSNAGMIVAGLIVEKVSGQDYFDYVQEHIYKPAGMADSGTWDKTVPQPNQAQGYMREDQQWIPNDETLPLRGSSAGGGDSTAPDLLRFDQALRGNKLLNAELTKTVTTAKVDIPNQKDKYAYGFFESMVDGKRIVGHGGGAPGMNANLDMYWDSGYTVVVLSNFDPPIAQQVNAYIRERIKQ